ncbi:hypothetical protein VH570_19780 [Sphingobium sp. HT1-2]|uniref:hypothetical protein n=1 Tax=Sphingobium sp. HT1-2 TaxID=3111640 RepID=UPI003C0DF093
MTENALTHVGKQILRGDQHYADAATPDIASEIVASAGDKAAVIDWLRHLAGEFVTPPILAFFGDPFARDGQQLCIVLADAIERGDHFASVGGRNGR